MIITGTGGIITATTAAGNGLLSDLICYWTLSEATGNRADSHTSGMTLLESGTVGTRTGNLYSNAADLDMEAPDYLYIAHENAAAVNFGYTDNWSFAMWLYPTAINHPTETPAYYRYIIGKNNASTFGGGWRFQTTAAGQIYYIFGIGGGAYHDKHTGLSVVLNQWNFMAFSQDASGSLYFRLNEDDVTDTNVSGFKVSTSGNFAVGSSATGVYIFDGGIGAVALWSRTLSTDDIDVLYNAGSGVLYEQYQ